MEPRGYLPGGGDTGQLPLVLQLFHQVRHFCPQLQLHGYGIKSDHHVMDWRTSGQDTQPPCSVPRLLVLVRGSLAGWCQSLTQVE